MSGRKRLKIYTATAVALTLLYVLLLSSQWQYPIELHQLSETSASLLALVCGVIALLRHFSHPDRSLLLLGAGLIGTSMLDAYHVIISTQWAQLYGTPEGAALANWSWLASRLYLAASMFACYLVWRHRRRPMSSAAHSWPTLLVTVGIALLNIWLITLAAEAFGTLQSYQLRLLELATSALFALALLGHWRQGGWRTSQLEHWLVLALLINLAVELMFVAHPYDMTQVEFDAAHLLKLAAYLCVLIGLLSDTYVTLRTVSDIAHQRERDANRLLLTSRELRQVIDTVGDAIVTSDSRGVISSFNPAAEQMFGYRADEVVGKNLSMLMPPQDASAHDGHMRRYVSDGEVRVIGKSRDNLYGLRADGSTFPIELTITDHDADGEKRFTGILRDVTERKRREQSQQEHQEELQQLVEAQTADLLRAKERAEAANQAKTEFLANMSHELRTPMHGILSFARLGERRHENAKREKLGDYFSKINVSGTRLLSLIDKLLDLSRLETGHFELSTGRHDLRVLLQRCIDEQAARVGELHVTLEVEDGGINTQAGFDADRIAQVITNLLSNAIKFSPPNSCIRLRFFEEQINMGGRRDDQFYVPGLGLSVSDEGVGIPESELESVFEKFTQGSATKTGAGGTGLGLAISREIIAAHNGRIWAAPAPNGGACVSFLLPRAAASTATADHASARTLSGFNP